MTKVVVAGNGFAALREHLAKALPGVSISAIEPDVLRRSGATGSVLIPAMSRIDGGIMDHIKGLQLIQQWGAGLEGVDLSAASERGIAVANVPSGGTGNAESVAEWCVMAAIALSRRLPELENGIRRGRVWGGPAGRGLRKRTAGVLGLGGIGCEVAVRLRVFGMRVIGLKRAADDEIAKRLGLDWIGGTSDLTEFLKQTDYLFLCLPVRAETAGLIGVNELASLPASAYVINASRGRLIDEEALIGALESGHLAGAALDVFVEEPLDPRSRLLELPNVIATPHIAGVTDTSYSDIADRVADNIRRLLAGEKLQNRVV